MDRQFLIRAQSEFAAGIIGKSVWQYIFLSAGFSDSEIKKTLRTIPSSRKLFLLPHGEDEIVFVSIPKINGMPITIDFYKEKFGITVACSDSQKEKEVLLQDMISPSGVFLIKKFGVADSNGKPFFLQRKMTKEIAPPMIQIQLECVHFLLTGNFVNTRNYVRCFCPQHKLIGVGACENYVKKIRVFFEGSQEGISNRLASVGGVRFLSV